MGGKVLHILIDFKDFMYLFERERDREHTGVGRGGDGEREVDSQLSAKPDWGST